MVDYSKPLPADMRKVRTAGVISPTTEKAWWYINPDSIDIFAQSVTGGVLMARLSRKQLERALKVMSDAE